MTGRLSKSALLSFSCLAAVLLHIVVAEPQLYEQVLQPAAVWLLQQAHILGAYAVGGFLELSCWLPLGWIAGCFFLSALAAFVLSEKPYPWYWLCPTICFLLGWFQMGDGIVGTLLCYSLPSLLGVQTGSWRDRRRKKFQALHGEP